MTYLNTFEMLHYLQLYIVFAFCPGKLKSVYNVFIFFFPGDILDSLQSTTCAYETESRNGFIPLRE